MVKGCDGLIALFTLCSEPPLYRVRPPPWGSCRVSMARPVVVPHLPVFRIPSVVVQPHCPVVRLPLRAS